jgi:hypothetical protein
VTEAQWEVAGNALLVMMTLSYLAGLVLLIVIWPRDRLEWSTTFKMAGMSGVLVNAVLVIYGLADAEAPVRLVLFAIATIFCWWFTYEAYRAWIHRRRP